MFVSQRELCRTRGKRPRPVAPKGTRTSWGQGYDTEEKADRRMTQVKRETKLSAAKEWSKGGKDGIPHERPVGLARQNLGCAHNYRLSSCCTAAGGCETGMSDRMEEQRRLHCECKGVTPDGCAALTMLMPPHLYTDFCSCGISSDGG